MIRKLRLLAFCIYFPAMTILALVPLQIPLGVQRGDLYLHAIAYLGLAQLAPWSFDRRGVVRFAVMAFAYGICIELVQHFITALNRNGDWTDVMANATGILLGIGLRLPIDRLLNHFSATNAGRSPRGA